MVGEDENGNPSVPCSLIYSEEDMVKQRMEYAMWKKDVGRNTRVLDEIGVYLARVGQCLLVIMMNSPGDSRACCGRRSGPFKILCEISSSSRVSVEYRI